MLVRMEAIDCGVMYVCADAVEKVMESRANPGNCFVSHAGRQWVVVESADVIASRINGALRKGPPPEPVNPPARTFKNIPVFDAVTSPVNKSHRLYGFVPFDGPEFEADLADVDFVTELPGGGTAVTFRNGKTTNVQQAFPPLVISLCAVFGGGALISKERDAAQPPPIDDIEAAHRTICRTARSRLDGLRMRIEQRPEMYPANKRWLGIELQRILDGIPSFEPPAPRRDD